MSDTTQYNASGMSREEITAPNVAVSQLKVSKMAMDGRVVNHITDDPTVFDPSTLPSSAALGLLQQKVTRDIRDVNTKVTTYQYNPVVSDPVASPHFLGDTWQIDPSVVLDLGKATFCNTGIVKDPQAILRIPAGAFVIPGTYFVEITISELPFGTIELRDQENFLLTTITAPGVTRLAILVESPDVESLELRIRGVPLHAQIVIDSVYVFLVKETLARYLDYAITNVGSGGLGFPNKEEMAEADAATLQAARAYSDTQAAEGQRNLDIHVQNHSNPHGVTYTQTGAAAAVHTHAPDQCGAAPVVHGHSPDQCGAAPASHGHTPVECGAAPAGHTHTYSDVGAAPTQHTHLPTECGAAPTKHTHLLADISDRATITQQIADAEARVTASLDITNTKLNAHTVSSNNPHHVSKSQVGLGAVENYPPATEAEARDAQLATRYMTPATSRASLSELLQQAGTEAQVLKPVPIYTVTLESAPLVLPIKYDRLYRIYIEHLRNGHLKEFGLALNQLHGGLTHYNNSCVGRTVNANDMGWFTQNEDCYRPFHPSIGPNAGCGELVLNTTNFTLTGLLDGRYLDDGGMETIAASVPVLYTGSLGKTSRDLARIPQSPTLILYSTSGVSLNTQVTIYELQGTTQDPIMVVDATPVGALTSYAGNVAPVGWSKKDGSELTRANYPELWQHAVTQGLVISEFSWQQQVSQNGFTEYFSAGDEVNTFRIPRAPSNQFTATTIPIIKIKLAQVPESKPILYRFIWNS